MKKKKRLDLRSSIVDPPAGRAGRGMIFLFFVVGVVLGVGVYIYGPRHGGVTWLEGRGNLAPTERAVVSRVVDGDTLVVRTQPTASQSGGQVKLRLIGMDAPELGSSELLVHGSEIRGKECYSEEAKEKLRELVENKEVKLEKDVSERDKYDRLLRYVYVGEENINELLVREGFAKLATYPPDTKYYGKLKEAQRVAREKKTGLWGACGE